MRRVVFVATVLCACAAPATASPTPFQTSSATAIVVTAPSSTPRTFVSTPDAKPLSGGCGQTTIVQGGMPQSLIDATGNNAPGGPYAIAHPATAAAFLFGYPLHMPDAGIAYSNKILWVVGTQRTGDLVIDGHPLGRAAPTVHFVQTPNSFPGEIYPSGIDVPVSGCWQFTLRWADRIADIELEYR